MGPLEKYKTATAVTSSSSNQLLFIFDEVLKLLVTAQKAIEDKDYDMKFKTLSKILEVLYLLKSGVDTKTMNKVEEAVDTFYGATIEKIENINMNDSSADELQPIIEAISGIRTAL